MHVSLGFIYGVTQKTPSATHTDKVVWAQFGLLYEVFDGIIGFAVEGKED